MGIDVIRAVLGIVLDGEDRRVPGIAGARDGFHEPTEREVVVGHHRLRGRIARPGRRRVVVRQPHDREPGQGSLPVELPKLRQPFVDPRLVLHLEIVPMVAGRHVPLE